MLVGGEGERKNYNDNYNNDNLQENNLKKGLFVPQLFLQNVMLLMKTFKC